LGHAEEQANRKETLKLCLDEIRSCRPFFIGLLGERYGWTPGADAFTADLQEEQPWLRGLGGKRRHRTRNSAWRNLTTTEIAGRSFFLLRDPAYAQTRGADFLSENAAAAGNQAALKEIRCVMPPPRSASLSARELLAPRRWPRLSLTILKEAIEAQFPH